MKQKITLTITPKQHTWLSQLAEDEGISKSELLRRIIEEWFGKQAREKGDN